MKDKILYKNKFLSLLKTEHNFIYAQRRNTNSTATLCFKREKGKILFLIRYQPLPVVHGLKGYKWNSLFACPITGSMEKNQTPLQNSIEEVYEEANICVTKKNLVAQCFNVSTTQMNETVFHFLYDVTNCKCVNKEQGDGTVFEKHSQNKWLTYYQVSKILKSNNKEYYLSSLVTCFRMFEEKYGKTKN